MLCYILSAYKLAVICILPPYLFYTVLLWRITRGSHTIEKLLRLILLLAGAAGIVAPIMIYEAQAFGLGGLWYILFAVLMIAAACKVKDDRIASSAAAACAFLCLPGAAIGILHAVAANV